MERQFGWVFKTFFVLVASLFFLSGCVSKPANTAFQQPSNIAIEGSGMPDFPDRSR